MSSDCIKLMPVAKTWKIIDVLFSTICKDPNFQEICLTLDPMLQARSGLSTMAHGFFHRGAKNVLLKVCCVFSNAVSKDFLPTHAYIVLCWFVRPLSSLQFSVYIFLSCTGRSWQSECKKEKTSVLAFKYKPKPWVTIVAWWHRIWYIIGRSDGFIIYKITFSWTIKYITWQVSSCCLYFWEKLRLPMKLLTMRMPMDRRMGGEKEVKKKNRKRQTRWSQMNRSCKRR